MFILFIYVYWAYPELSHGLWNTLDKSVQNIIYVLILPNELGLAKNLQLGLP